MPSSVVQLLAKRDRIEEEIRERFVDRWQIVQAEIGVPPDLRSIEPPSRLELRDTRLLFTVPVRVPATSWQQERQAQMQITIPIEAAECDPLAVSEVLRREWPLQCAWCGLTHQAGITRCTSNGNCWGALCWRTESPRPRFYVESAGSYGYFPQGPCPRGLRYAIDLSDYSLFGVQVTLRNSDRWIDPVKETVANIVGRLTDSIATDLISAIEGNITTHSNPACLSFEGPVWCPESARRVRLSVRPSNMRLLSA